MSRHAVPAASALARAGQTERKSGPAPDRPQCACARPCAASPPSSLLPPSRRAARREAAAAAAAEEPEEEPEPPAPPAAVSQPAAAASALHAAALGGRAVRLGPPPAGALAEARRAGRCGGPGAPPAAAASSGGKRCPRCPPAPDGGPPCAAGPGREAFPAAVAVEGKAGSGRVPGEPPPAWPEDPPRGSPFAQAPLLLGREPPSPPLGLGGLQPPEFPDHMAGNCGTRNPPSSSAGGGTGLFPPPGHCLGWSRMPFGFLLNNLQQRSLPHRIIAGKKMKNAAHVAHAGCDCLGRGREKPGWGWVASQCPGMHRPSPLISRVGEMPPASAQPRQVAALGCV